MKLTIIRDGGLVQVDGIGFNDLDLGAVPVNIHALQWDGSTGRGEVEYSDGSNNLVIDSLPSWANTAKSKFDEKDAEEKRLDAEAKAYAESNEGKAEAARAKRDQLIAQTDWWALSDNTMTDAQKNYRQELRDITKQQGFPSDISWPVKP